MRGDGENGEESDKDYFGAVAALLLSSTGSYLLFFNLTIESAL